MVILGAGSLDTPSYIMVMMPTTWNLLEIFNNAHDNMNFHVLTTTNFTPGPGPFLPILREICRQSIQNPSLVTWGNLVTDLFFGGDKVIPPLYDGNTHIGYINFGFITLIWKWWSKVHIKNGPVSMSTHCRKSQALLRKQPNADLVNWRCRVSPFRETSMLQPWTLRNAKIQTMGVWTPK